MKILRGDLTETRYAFPEDNDPEGQMTIISEKTYKENQATYMADELGLHRVSNRGSDFAVSLHCKHSPSPRTLVLDLTKELFSVYSSQRS
jgi:cysteine dioxygenase